MTSNQDDIERAVRCELALLDPAVRRDREAVDSLLGENFSEIGKSGRRWTREEMLDSIGSVGSVDTDSATPVEVSEMEGRIIAADLVLLTYVLSHAGIRTRRSSLWQRSTQGWKLTFHQGTRLLGNE